MTTAIDRPRNRDALLAENARLEERLEQVEEILSAIRSGAADAITVDTPAGPRVFALRGAETPYRAMVETMSEGAATATPNGIVLYCNRRFAELLGREVDAVLGTNLPDAFVGADAAKVKAALHEDPVTMVRFRANLAKPGALPIPVNVAMRALDDVQTPTIVIVISDLSEIVAAQDAAVRDERSAARYARSLIEVSLDPLVTISADGKISDVNRATEEATGYTRAELIGSDFADYFVEPDKARAGYREAFEKGSVIDYALTLRHRSGAVKDVLYNASVYRDPQGEGLGVFAAARDVTSRKRAEESRARATRALRLVNACNNIMIHAAEETKLLEDACRAIVEIGGYRLAWVGYAEDDPAKSVRPVAWAGVNGDYIGQAEISWSETDERGRGPTGAAIRAGKLFIARDTETDPNFAPWSERAVQSGLRSSAAAPLKGNGKVYGALIVCAGESDAFDAEETRLLSELADDLAFATASLRTKADLQQSERRFRTAFESSTDCILVWDRDYRYLYANEAAIRYVGTTRDKVIGKTIREGLGHIPEFMQLWMQRVDRAIATGQISRYDDHGVVAGREVWSESVVSPLRNEAGQTYAVTVVYRDATERKKTETALALSEERYRTLVRATSLLVWGTDPSGNVVDLPEWREFTGQTAQEVAGAGWSNALHPDDRERTVDIWRKAVEARALYDTEYRVRRHDGEYRDMAARGVPVLDADGSIREWVGTCTDITERKRAEAALLDAQQRLALALKAGRAGTFEWNIRHNVNRWSPEIEDLYGVPRGTFGGTFEAWQKLVFPEDQAAAMANIEVSLKTGNFSGEWRVRRPDGSTIWLSASAVVQFGADGKPDRMIGANFDITARKEAEEEVRRLNAELEQRVVQRTAQLQAANSELEAFSYSVSHDLRTPLRAIDGFSRILLEDHAANLDAEGQRVLNVVRDSTVKMSHLIDDILAFSRAGRTEMSPVPVDMEALVRSILADALAAAVSKRQIAFEIGSLPAARGDRAMLERVWTNLLDNAIKFTGSKPDARIEIGATTGDGEMIYHVRDNGVGFDMQYAGKLFGVFQRLHGTEIPGTGIGLAIVKRLVARHGGRVWAEGAVGAGATFYFSLPAEEKADA